jgi:hypothetical protein
MSKASVRPFVSHTAESNRALEALRKALADFDDIEIAEPAVKPKGEQSRAIKKAVRDFYAPRPARARG